MPGEDTKINCPTFQKQEPAIKETIAKINSAKEVSEKAELARQLQEEVDVLLSCPDHDKNNVDCNNCRFIANVRRKTAYLIRKAEKLA
jgi:hypothetical protein